MRTSFTAWIAAAIFAVSAASGAVRETLDFSAIISNGQRGAASNTFRTDTLAGGYALGRVNFSGSLTSLTAATLLIDSRILITAPNGQTLVFQPFATGSTFTSQSFNINLYIPHVTSTAGTWSFRFYELIDNGGSATPDARWQMTVSFTDEAAPVPSSVNLGTIAEPGTTLSSQSLSGGQVRWYRFTLDEPVTAASYRYLDIDLPGAIVGTSPSNDTEMGLYDSQGYVVAADDDSGPGFSSQLSFGVGGDQAVLDGEVFTGANGDLAAGLYYLAITAHEATFAPFWQATTASSTGGSFSLRLRSGVVPPCPADFNQDGGIDGTDVEAFFASWEGGLPDADVNADGGIDGSDVETFFAAWEAGGCG